VVVAGRPPTGYLEHTLWPDGPEVGPTEPFVHLSFS
jgi:hypothetical protein